MELNEDNVVSVYKEVRAFFKEGASVSIQHNQPGDGESPDKRRRLRN